MFTLCLLLFPYLFCAVAVWWWKCSPSFPQWICQRGVWTVQVSIPLEWGLQTLVATKYKFLSRYTLSTITNCLLKLLIVIFHWLLAFDIPTEPLAQPKKYGRLVFHFHFSLKRIYIIKKNIGSTIPKINVIPFLLNLCFYFFDIMFDVTARKCLNHNYICFHSLRNFLLKVCDVPEPEERFNIDEYADFVNPSKPIVYMSVKEIIDTHAVSWHF